MRGVWTVDFEASLSTKLRPTSLGYTQLWMFLETKDAPQEDLVGERALVSSTAGQDTGTGLADSIWNGSEQF